MPYTVSMDEEDDGTFVNWTEPNKDEVIDRLVWLLRRGGNNLTVTYPDGSVW